MNGTYKISLKTPMGLKTGTIKLEVFNGVLSGSLNALGTENPITNGKANGNTFEFSGSLKTILGKIEYTANGTVTGDVLQASAKTKYGLMQISGTRE